MTTSAETARSTTRAARLDAQGGVGPPPRDADEPVPPLVEALSPTGETLSSIAAIDLALGEH
jgi:hypothetical protein